MKLKAKLVSTIAAFCLVLCLTIVGVWAVTSATVTMGGNISFTATDVNATVTFNEFTGVSVAPTPEKLVYNGTEESSTPSSGDVSTWSDWNLTFSDKGTPAVLKFTIANTHGQNDLKVKFTDSSNLTAKTNNCTIAVTDNNAGDVTAAEGITLATGESVQITVTITIDDKNESVSAAALNFSLVLEDEHHTAG